ncbi:MAG: hypothetical protein JWO67_7181 [Streptosporangiaceae bacterium]|nr:hypothetical protein [Streptosporangiaceae bacterium]
MTATDELARGQYRSQQLLAREAAQQAQRAWRQIDPGDIAGSWRTLLAAFLKLFVGYQGAAVRGGIGYAGQVVDAAGAVRDPIGTVNPTSLVGVASDGRGLESLLQTPMIDTFADIQRGVTAEDALRSGLHRLVTITSTEVADAGRVATGLAVTADRAISGYVRIVTLPACGRCILLAGREYSHSTGFLRHPRCDCTMRPLTADEWDSPLPGTDPQEMFDQMTAEQQARAFTVAGARAIRDGADIGRVVNARRGMSTAAGPGGRKIRTTTEATTSRSVGRTLGQLRKTPGSRHRRSTVSRLMPEEIYWEAERLGWDREEIVRQLKRFGYIY